MAVHAGALILCRNRVDAIVRIEKRPPPAIAPQRRTFESALRISHQDEEAFDGGGMPHRRSRGHGYGLSIEQFFEQHRTIGKPAFLLVVLDGFRLRVDHMIFVNGCGPAIGFCMCLGAESRP